MRFLGIILRVLRLEVSEYNFYIINKFQITFAGGDIQEFDSNLFITQWTTLFSLSMFHKETFKTSKNSASGQYVNMI
jgi:hypothetical protein